MLPDFASMTGRRLSGADHVDVAAGVEIHLRSDSAFHDSPDFRELCLDGTRTLRERGVPRGAARGAAHVGIELLLDGALVGDAGVCESYVAALRAGADTSLRAKLRWSQEDGDSRWHELHTRLVLQGIPLAYRDPARVAERVERALSQRPRLALPTEHRETVETWLVQIQKRVHDAAPSLLEHVQSRIS